MDKATCSVNGCERKTRARGWCEMHYDRWRSSGDPGEAETRKQKRRGICTVDDCGRPEMARGLCHTHYARRRRDGDLPAGIRRYQKRNGACSVEGCGRRIFVQRLCNMHHQRLLRMGETGPAGRLRAENGTGSLSKGYRIDFTQGRKIGRHRLVMAEVIGRPLHPFETPHHRNGIRDDNRPENLELWTKPQPAGQRPEDLAAWVVEFYPELVEAALARREAGT